MLEIIRNKTQGFFAWAVILVIAGIFAFLGLNDYLGSRGSSSREAAKVNGEKISWRTIDVLYQRILRDQDAQLGNELQLKAQIRLALVQRLALLMGAKEQGFRVNDEQVVEALRQIPAFQVEGKFSKEKYKEMIASNGYSENEFLQELSQDILLGQLQHGLSQSALSYKQDLTRAVELLEQTRNFGFMTIPAQKNNAVAISDEDVKNFYEAHKNNFVLPEQVAVDYIELSVDELMKKMAVSEDALKAFYNENPALFSNPEKVHARHILISTSKEDDANAKAKAEEILAKVKNGGDFSALAQTESSDIVSAKQGGDLGWFGRGEMVPEFEQAAFDLKKPGEVAGPIQTDYGYHLIQLIEHKAPESRAYADVKDEVNDQYRRTKAEAQFKDLNEKLVKLASTHPNDLQSIAEALGLTVATTDLFSKVPDAVAPATGIAQFQEIRAAAFSTPVLKNGKNSDIIRSDDSRVALIHLNKHQVARQQDQVEVEKIILDQVGREKATAKAKEIGEYIVQRLKEGDAPEELAKKHQLQWISKSNINRANQDVDRMIGELAFKSPAPDKSSGKPGVSGVVLPNGDFIALAVTKVSLGTLDKVDAATKDSYQKSLAEAIIQVEYGLYANQILSKSKVVFSEMMPLPEEEE